MGRERRYDMRERLGLTAAGAGVGTPWDRAGKEEPVMGDFLCDLLQAEIAARNQRSLETRLKGARLPYRNDA